MIAPPPGAQPRPQGARPDLDWSGRPASRLPRFAWSIRRTGQGCQGQSSGAPPRRWRSASSDGTLFLLLLCVPLRTTCPVSIPVRRWFCPCGRRPPWAPGRWTCMGV